MRMSERTLNALIGGIYDAAVEPGSIPQVLQQACDLLACASGVIGFHDEETIISDTIVGLDPYWVPLHRELQHQNLYFHRRHAVRPGKAVLGGDLVRPEEWEGVPYYHEVLLPSGCAHMLGLSIVNEPGLFAELSLYRPQTSEPHGPQELKIADILAGHLSRAFRVGRYLHEAAPLAKSLANALEQLSTGCLVVDATGRLIFANAEGEAFLTRADLLRVANGQITAAPGAASEWRLLLSRLRQADSSAAGTVIHVGAACGETLRLHAVPLAAERAETLGLALPSSQLGLIVIGQPGRISEAMVELLRQAFGLTAAESSLAAAIAQGESLSAYAKRRARSLNTVKTHLKAVFAKTGTSRQADLVRLMMRFGLS